MRFGGALGFDEVDSKLEVSEVRYLGHLSIEPGFPFEASTCHRREDEGRSGRSNAGS